MQNTCKKNQIVPIRDALGPDTGNSRRGIFVIYGTGSNIFYSFNITSIRYLIRYNFDNLSMDLINNFNVILLIV